MTAHPYIHPYTLDLSDSEEKSADVLRLFDKAAENTPAPMILEDLDRAFPTEGKRTQERTVSFQTLLNCLDGVGIAGRGDRCCYRQRSHVPRPSDPEAPRPVRPRGSVQFRSLGADLRRKYYRRLNATLAGEQFEIAIEQT
jgi:hypothetical protein